MVPWIQKKSQFWKRELGNFNAWKYQIFFLFFNYYNSYLQVVIQWSVSTKSDFKRGYHFLQNGGPKYMGGHQFLERKVEGS